MKINNPYHMILINTMSSYHFPLTGIRIEISNTRKHKFPLYIISCSFVTYHREALVACAPLRDPLHGLVCACLFQRPFARSWTTPSNRLHLDFLFRRHLGRGSLGSLRKLNKLIVNCGRCFKNKE